MMLCRSRSQNMACCVLLAVAASQVLLLPSAASAKSDPYYKVPPIFFPCPNSIGGKSWNVKNFGPVGIGITLKPLKPGFEMVINNVEKDSPAAATGKLKKGQVIQSINGTVLKDKDPRIILGDLITEAEAKDGKIALDIKDLGTVVVTIPIMGEYSKTWPLNCPKSDRIVRNLADLLAKQEKPGWGSVLFMLSTGEEKDLDVVRQWMSEKLETLGTLPVARSATTASGCASTTSAPVTSECLPIIAEAAEQLQQDDVQRRVERSRWAGQFHLQHRLGPDARRRRPLHELPHARPHVRRRSG
jgi:hypothetical protein